MIQIVTNKNTNTLLSFFGQTGAKSHTRFLWQMLSSDLEFSHITLQFAPWNSLIAIHLPKSGAKSENKLPQIAPLLEKVKIPALALVCLKPYLVNYLHWLRVFFSTARDISRAGH